MNLQLFDGGDSSSSVEAVAGKNLIYLYRVLKDAATKAGTGIAFTTENSRSKSKDADAVNTKDGAIRVPSGGEVEISTTAILTKGDTMFASLEGAMDSDDIIELWEVNLSEAGTASGTFKGRYFQGYLTDMEVTSSAEDMVEVALTFGINGNGATGDVTVSEQQQAIAAYVFKDATKTGA